MEVLGKYGRKMESKVKVKKRLNLSKAFSYLIHLRREYDLAGTYV